MKYYVYILQSKIDHCYYIGQTNNLENRLKRHASGQVRSTRRRRPFTLILSEEFNSRSEAIRRESYLKSLKGGNEFRKIINQKI